MEFLAFFSDLAISERESIASFREESAAWGSLSNRVRGAIASVPILPRASLAASCNPVSWLVFSKSNTLGMAGLPHFPNCSMAFSCSGLAWERALTGSVHTSCALASVINISDSSKMLITKP